MRFKDHLQMCALSQTATAASNLQSEVRGEMQNTDPFFFPFP